MTLSSPHYGPTASSITTKFGLVTHEEGGMFLGVKYTYPKGACP